MKNQNKNYKTKRNKLASGALIATSAVTSTVGATANTASAGLLDTLKASASYIPGPVMLADLQTI